MPARSSCAVPSSGIGFTGRGPASLHHKRSCVQRHAASMAYTTTPVTETYSQMGSVKRAILRCCRKRPLREKKKVVSTIGSATTESTTWLIRMRQINRPHRAKSRKVRLAMQRMIGDVADQKEGRENKRYDHRHAMGRNIPLANEIKASEQSDRAQPVEHRIQRRQKAKPRGRSIERMVEVKQPQQKANRRRTDGDNQGHRERNRRALVGFRY